MADLFKSIDSNFHEKDEKNSLTYRLVKDSPWMKGCRVHGKTILPISAYLVLVWRAFFKQNKDQTDTTPIELEQVHFTEDPPALDERKEFAVSIHPKSGNFEVTCEDTVLMYGTIRFSENVESELNRQFDNTIQTDDKNLLPQTAEDIYEELARRGYICTTEIKSLDSSDPLGKTGVIAWNQDMISFIDAMFQFRMAGLNTSYLYLPIKVEKIIIEPKLHNLITLGRQNNVPINLNQERDLIAAGGVQILGVKFNFAPRNEEHKLFEKYTLVLSKTRREYQKVAEKNQTVEHAYAIASSPGDLSSLNWVQNPIHLQNNNHDVKLCHVFYATLNHVDLIHASGKQLASERIFKNTERSLGIEFSGKTSTGKRIMGILSSQALATTVIPEEPFLWDVPKNWTLESAASVPVAYVTAYYLLMHGGIKPRETILVYNGASDIGIATLTLAIHAGCKIYTVEENRDKKQFVWSRFLEISRTNISYETENISVEKTVLEGTKGYGVDVVINNFGIEKISQGMRCLAKGGRFLQVRPEDGTFNMKTLNTSSFSQNKSFHYIDINCMNYNEKQTVAGYVQEGISTGQVAPTYTTNLHPEQLETAFRFMSKGDQIGKMVIRIRDEENSEDIKKVNIKVKPRVFMDSIKSYVILTEHLNNLSLQLAKWLTTRGATKILVNSKNGVTTGYQSKFIRRLEENGVEVILSKANMTNKDEAKTLLEDANKLGPVGGIFDLSGQFEESASIDVASRNETIKQLEHFVIFLQATKNIDNDQKFKKVEHLIEERRKNGFCGLIIRYEFNNQSEELYQGIAYFIEALDSLFVQPHAVVGIKMLE